MKITLKISMILFIVFQTNVIAQPILSSQNISPIVGEVFKFTHGYSFNPGPSGTNQNWNAIPSVTTFTFENQVISPTMTPYDTSFSNATFSTLMPIGPSVYYNYIYFQSSINEIKYIGGSSNSNMTQYIDAEDILRFPFSYGDSYTDTWTVKKFDYSINTYDSYITTGTTTVTYDGVGTITTPSGSFTNASRVHITRTMDNPYYHENRDEYKWYLGENHQPIATTYTVNQQIPGNPSYNGSEFLNDVMVSISELEKSGNKIIMFPNPAASQVKFIINKINVKSLEINDIAGNIIYNKNFINHSLNNNIILDITDFINGIYIVKLTSIDGTVFSKKLLVSK